MFEFFGGGGVSGASYYAQSPKKEHPSHRQERDDEQQIPGAPVTLNVGVDGAAEPGRKGDGEERYRKD